MMILGIRDQSELYGFPNALNMVVDTSKTYDTHQTSSSELQPRKVELMHAHSKDTTTVSFTQQQSL